MMVKTKPTQRRRAMSRIKEGLIGYDELDEDTGWYAPVAKKMVDELVEYQVYCMSLSEITQRVARQVREDYYSQDILLMHESYKKVFGTQEEDR
tara:strand:- start:368 stop:649 length:282 start_codon:yes stop_codon:yes gene_type:complete